VGAILRELFEHNLWANLRLVDACDGLSEEQLDASEVGTYGSIRDTLVHIGRGEGRYVAFLSNRSPEEVPANQPFPGFQVLRQRLRESGEALRDLCTQFDGSELMMAARRGAPFHVRSAMLLMQVINHSTEHRSQVNTILTQIGVAPAPVDVWTYNDGLVNSP
jgi:uncharacterized damage-inducible protein DinB